MHSLLFDAKFKVIVLNTKNFRPQQSPEASTTDHAVRYLYLLWLRIYIGLRVCPKKIFAICPLRLVTGSHTAYFTAYIIHHMPVAYGD